MPTNPNGALGLLDYKKEERRTLAIKSCYAAPRFGTPERQKLIVQCSVILGIFWRLRRDFTTITKRLVIINYCTEINKNCYWIVIVW
ncbi:hypothetical protein AHAS_Ahas12G0191000 [Arachis hypogaea]